MILPVIFTPACRGLTRLSRVSPRIQLLTPAYKGLTLPAWQGARSFIFHLCAQRADSKGYWAAKDAVFSPSRARG
jgi:hypothetical protein